MLWHFFKATTPDQVTPPIVLSYAHGIGLSGKPPSPVTIGARIACLSSYFHFLIRMGLVTSNPCDLVERPRQSHRDDGPRRVALAGKRPSQGTLR
jgi:site-specific recombinase XerD